MMHLIRIELRKCVHLAARLFNQHFVSGGWAAAGDYVYIADHLIAACRLDLAFGEMITGGVVTDQRGRS